MLVGDSACHRPARIDKPKPARVVYVTPQAGVALHGDRRRRAIGFQAEIDPKIARQIDDVVGGRVAGLERFEREAAGLKSAEIIESISIRRRRPACVDTVDHANRCLLDRPRGPCLRDDPEQRKRPRRCDGDVQCAGDILIARSNLGFARAGSRHHAGRGNRGHARDR